MNATDLRSWAPFRWGPRRLYFPCSAHPGDRVSIIYALTPVAAAAWRRVGFGYIGDLFAFRGNYPVQRVRYVLRSPRPIAATAVRVAAASQRRSGGQFISVWSGGPYRPFWREAGGPSITDASPHVQPGAFMHLKGLACRHNPKPDEPALAASSARSTMETDCDELAMLVGCGCAVIVTSRRETKLLLIVTSNRCGTPDSETASLTDMLS